jgi:low affinity Fe/Cu permease
MYYWIFIVFVLLAAKIFGFADDGKTMVVIIGLATVLYIGINMIYATSHRAAAKSKFNEQNKKNKTAVASKTAVKKKK